MKFTIKGRMDGLNDYQEACRIHPLAGAKMKKQNKDFCEIQIINSKVRPVKDYPVTFNITWYEPSRRRDADNIVSAKKFLLDALVNTGILTNDSQKYVIGFTDKILIDKDNPRIEVEIIEGSK